MKYSSSFERDFKWYLSMRHRFNFDGAGSYINKKGAALIVKDNAGKDAKHCFYAYDSMGEIIPTRHPKLLKTLLRTKGSVNLHIKMFAEDRATGILPGIEFQEYCKTIKAPTWFERAVETKKALHFTPEFIKGIMNENHRKEIRVVL